MERAPAKVNLALAVTGRRPDGYHLLDTLAVFADIADTLTAAPGDGFSLTIDGPFAERLSDGDDNLVLRAASLLAENARLYGHEAPGARLHLTKRLPPASGLGGGSADGAATLRALNRLWRLGYGCTALAELGTRLGADVAMCAYSRPLRAGGIGDRIVPLDGLPPLPMVLANPGVELATGKVFATRKGEFSPPLPEADSFSDPDAVAAWLRPLENDLEAPARLLAPVIAELLVEMRALPGCLLARMSGSGASCFALFADMGAAENAARNLAAEHADWWVEATIACRGLSTGPNSCG